MKLKVARDKLEKSSRETYKVARGNFQKSTREIQLLPVANQPFKKFHGQQKVSREKKTLRHTHLSILPLPS